MKLAKNTFEINGVMVGDGHPCFITFEAGPTHQGLESAKKLAKYAKDSGGNAIKFQIFDPLRLVADPNLPFTYQTLKSRLTGELETVTEPLRDILIRRQMKEQEWRELKKYCDNIGIAFFATACFPEDVDFLVDIGCQSIKIASADVNHLPFIRYAAKTELCIQLDTGMASIGEIEIAVDTIRSEGNNNIIIHHCPSGYPAHLESINLRAIPTIQQAFECPVAFSDHSVGWDMDIAAVSIGANLVEKTITEDRTIKSVEHVMSLEPQDMKNFVQIIRDLEVALGNNRRVLSDVEKNKRNAVRRSIYIAHDLPAGHVLTEADIDYCRPGIGISPDKLETVLSKALKFSLPAGTRISLEDLI
ncbi:N-acetylneuraminate synthase [Candidatus Methylopumilus universalis]|uniref:N-acetylneuraminate synthase family protein n=1 Tax=Candidatus Methylopumilus universalis TaxID=2588536 RepID=UPI0011235105|nr:N-acetylneuraminate synthase family protein [Candidatus Methylopumilus universalis]QDC47524.1 N-acetylneuraminate synthase [Candidatus Methylopumilus universalis]QDC72057.1 N-acetylneuraminate synthase [Candidatus Methylopumilus universalis]